MQVRPCRPTLRNRTVGRIHLSRRIKVGRRKRHGEDLDAGRAGYPELRKEEKEMRVEIGRLVAEAVRSAGYTSLEMAQKLGYRSPAQISKWSSGKAAIPPEKIALLASMLGRSVLDAQNTKGSRLVCPPPALPDPLHANKRLMTQPRRTILRRDHTKANSPRNLHERLIARNRDDQLYRATQQ
ncbi:hypothetical protein BH09SUM1_BH09SUM1_18870 [soil metagenome]